MCVCECVCMWCVGVDNVHTHCTDWRTLIPKDEELVAGALRLNALQHNRHNKVILQMILVTDVLVKAEETIMIVWSPRPVLSFNIFFLLFFGIYG